MKEIYYIWAEIGIVCVIVNFLWMLIPEYTSRWTFIAFFVLTVTTATIMLIGTLDR